ncbi:MAG: HAMP domain-containing sensor histidine kinase [Clostridia bacterium]|nr:HAMP domain-containing sensor histidine kinase [Clostridia bacterium]
MRSRKRDRGDYSRLRRKVFLGMLLIVFAAIAAVLFLCVLAMGRIRAGVVGFLERAFRLATDDAQRIYLAVFGDYMSLYILIAIVVFFIIFIRFSLSWFTRYFNEISAGLDQLVERSDADIALSPELDFMERKLNKIKNTLDKQRKDAQEAEQRKNDLVVYLAHDIKTPLTSVIGYLSLLDEARDMPAEQRARYMGITLEKAYRLEQLIDEFFEVTRFNLRSIVLNKARINLPFMLHQMADEFYPMLAPGGRQVVVHALDGLTLWGDADKLSRVFNNILKNAMAYSYEGSTIRITASQEGENVVIAFANLGDPIPSEKLETIFDQFFRLDASRSTHSGGAGLGLAIAKEIVVAHGGAITVQSDKEQTVFTVILPSKSA